MAGGITAQDSIDEIVAAAGDTIHGLANVAGINDDFSPLNETSDEMWEKVLDVNLTGPFKLTRAVLPHMLESAARQRLPRLQARGGGHDGVRGLHVRAHGIRVNAVGQGGVATGIRFPPSETVSGRLKALQAQIPTLATPGHIAASITCPLSEGRVNLNGVIPPSDGGWSVQ